MKTKKSTLLFILLAAYSFVQAQDPLQLTLAQCRKMAIENSKTLKIADEQITKAQGQKAAAKAAWFPNISASATGVFSKQEIKEEFNLPTKVYNETTGKLVPNLATDPVSGNPIIGSDGLPIFNTYAYLPIDLTIYGGAVAGLSAKQSIYAGGKIIAGNKMAQIGENMAMNNRELKQSDLIYHTDQTYYQYLSVKEKVKLAKEYQHLLKELVSMVKNSYEVGMTNNNELLKVQVKYNEASLQVQKAETGLALSQMTLCQYIGVNLRTPLEINDSITNIHFSLDSINNRSAENRIEYQLLQSQVEMAQQNIKMVRGDYMPTAGVSLGYNYFVMSLKDMNNYDQHGYNAIASVKIPITTFGERKGKVKAAKADYVIKQLHLNQTTEYLQLEIEQARLYFMDAYTQVEMTNTALEQANENMRISDDSYNLGMETIVNLLEAKAEWQKAYSNKIDALTHFKVQESNLLRVSTNFQ